MEWINEIPNGIELKVRAVPRASKNEIQGLHDGELKIRLTTPPVDGKANQDLIRFLSKTLRISKARIELAQGETSRHKTVRISGITSHEFIARSGL